MSIQSIIENEIIQDEFQVWSFKGRRHSANVKEGSPEKYLYKVFRNVEDLGSQSNELGKYIKDRASEYHLSKKRSQLLSGFSFDRSSKVLEVGSKCGVITRFLGENFDQVTAVESDITHARLTKQRAKGLDSVSVICAPLQEINFVQKFDLIFCIGGVEYSTLFMEKEDPYDAMLQYFANILSPNGRVVIAIENQFGIKYFNGAQEDYTGRRFEGLEGYHKSSSKMRTFGKIELEDKLRKYFSEIEFYYPFPDYKLPNCVVSSEFLASGRAGELVSQFSSHGHGESKSFLWDEMTTILELDRNKSLEFFSNSFLIFAGFSTLSRKFFGQEALFYSNDRKLEYSTQTRIIKDEMGKLRVIKHQKTMPEDRQHSSLKMVKTESFWIDAQSLQTQLSFRMRAQNGDFNEIFKPCRPWINFLTGQSDVQDGIDWLDGKYIDVIWSNTYIIGNECQFIDQEWAWDKKIRLNVIVIRAIYDFLARLEKNAPQISILSMRSGKTLIKNIAKSLGIQLLKEDFKEFIKLEAQIAAIVAGSSKLPYIFYLQWFLIDRPTRRLACWVHAAFRTIASKITARVMNLF